MLFQGESPAKMPGFQDKYLKPMTTVSNSWWIVTEMFVKSSVVKKPCRKQIRRQITPIWQKKHHRLKYCTSLRGDVGWCLQRVTMVAPTKCFRSLSNPFKHEISLVMINHTILDDKYISNDSPVIKVLLQCVTSSSSLGWGCFEWSKTDKKTCTEWEACWLAMLKHLRQTWMSQGVNGQGKAIPSENNQK